MQSTQPMRQQNKATLKATHNYNFTFNAPSIDRAPQHVLRNAENRIVQA